MSERYRWRVRNVLQATRDLLGDPDRWHQGALAVDAQGQETSPSDGDAVAFCIMGAVKRSARGAHWTLERGARFAVEAAIHQTTSVMDGVEIYNDLHSHAEVLHVLDVAVEMLAEPAAQAVCS